MLKRLLSVCLLLFAPYSLANTERDPQLQKIFQQAMAAVNKGEYQSAIDGFRVMLKVNPNLIRPRLELARTLYKIEQYKIARYHFEQILSAKLPKNVRANINRFILRIREELPSFSMSLDVEINKKIPRRTKKIIYINGFPFPSGNTSYAGTGVKQHQYTLRVNGKIPISPIKKTFAKVGLEHTDINGSDNATTYLNSSIGKHYSLANSATITPELGFHHLIYYDHKLYDGVTFSVKYFKPIGKSNNASLAYSYKQLNYVENPNSSGAEKSLSATFAHLPSISSRIDTSLSLLKHNAKDEAQAFNKLSLNLSYAKSIGSFWDVGANLKTSKTDYKGAGFGDNGVKKKDKTVTFEITLLNKAWHYKNIAPKLTIGKTKNHSNIDIYEDSEPYVKLGFTRQF